MNASGGCGPLLVVGQPSWLPLLAGWKPAPQPSWLPCGVAILAAILTASPGAQGRLKSQARSRRHNRAVPGLAVWHFSMRAR